MLKKLRQSNQGLALSESKGFTIIEVLIVLAIAALILLIVFLAVPALQRNSRNNGRKNDASRLASAVSDFVSNHNGQLPSGGFGWPGDCATILNDVGNLNQGSFSGNCTVGEGANNFVYKTGSFTPAAQTSGFEVILVSGATCNGGSATVGTPRQSALLYDLETATGNYDWACISAT